MLHHPQALLQCLRERKKHALFQGVPACVCVCVCGRIHNTTINYNVLLRDRCFGTGMPHNTESVGTYLRSQFVFDAGIAVNHIWCYLTYVLLLSQVHCNLKLSQFLISLLFRDLVASRVHVQAHAYDVFWRCRLQCHVSFLVRKLCLPRS